MIIAGTGHRPDKLGGYSEQLDRNLILLARRVCDIYQPTVIISGMALGWDLALADVAVERDILLHAYLPFEGQANRWPFASQERYRRLLHQAKLVKVCSPGGYSAYKMQIRNERMVDDCELLVALWNGEESGTANCVRYARTVGRPRVNCWKYWSETYGTA